MLHLSSPAILNSSSCHDGLYSVAAIVMSEDMTNDLAEMIENTPHHHILRQRRHPQSGRDSDRDGGQASRRGSR